MGGPLRVGQLPPTRVAERQALGRTGAPTSRSRCASTGLKRRGTNRLVVRVDSRRLPTDFPPSGLTATGGPTGGWWNYGGLLREVYLRRIDTSSSRRSGCPGAAVRHVRRDDRGRGALRNVTGRAAARRVTAASAAAASRWAPWLAGPGAQLYTSDASGRKPRLWTPASPNLYRVSRDASAGGRKRRRLPLHKRRAVDQGRPRAPVAQRRPVNLRGVGLHEDSKDQGFAVDNAVRERLVAEAKDLGATVMRTHYPMHPYMHELADRKGLLIWSEIPVYAVKTQYLSARPCASSRPRSCEEHRANQPPVGDGVVDRQRAVLAARPGAGRLHPAGGRGQAPGPLAPGRLAVAGYPSAGCQPEYAPLDVIGVNEYFGWYPGPNGSLFDRTGPAPTSTRCARATRTRRSW